MGISFALRSDTDGQLYGLMIVGMGVLSLCCALCWKRFVPLTAEVLRVAATVFGRNKRMILTGFACIALSLVWYVVVACTFISLFANASKGTSPMGAP